MRDGIFAPDMPINGDVLDPDRVTPVFDKAYELASQPTHYQFIEGGFDNIDLLKLSDHAVPFKTSQSASLGCTEATWPLIPADAGADSKLWLIPHNRDFVTVGDPDDPMETTWTTAHPEMVVVFWSAQYVRRDVTGPKDGAATGWTEWADFFAGASGRGIRAQILLELDGVLQPASGPFARAQDGKVQGTGLGQKAAAPSHMSVLFVQAGSHTLRLRAAQASAWSTGEAETDSDQYVSTALNHGVCIGNATLFGIRFRYGQRATL